MTKNTGKDTSDVGFIYEFDKLRNIILPKKLDADVAKKRPIFIAFIWYEVTDEVEKTVFTTQNQWVAAQDAVNDIDVKEWNIDWIELIEMRSDEFDLSGNILWPLALDMDDSESILECEILLNMREKLIIPKFEWDWDKSA